MKEIYASNHMWTVFERSFLPDMNQLADNVATAISSTSSTSGAPITLFSTKTIAHRQLVRYVCNALMTVVASFFGSPFSSTAAAAAVAAGVGGISISSVVQAEESVSSSVTVSSQQQSNATITSTQPVSQ